MQTRSISRVSKGLPRKRPSYDLEDVRPSRPKKRIRPPPAKKFPLMKLPTEIRMKILRELLWQPEHLHVIPEEYPDYTRTTLQPGIRMRPERKNFDFHPAILQTCRQLNEEGCSILYEENTVDVKIWLCLWSIYQFNISWMGTMIGPERDSERLRSVPYSLVSRIRKLHITVKFKHPLEGIRMKMRNLVRRLVQVLQANPQWNKLSIHLKDDISEQNRAYLRENPVGEEGEFQIENIIDPEILRPFSFLRRLHSVDITGVNVSPEFATKLSSVMKSDEPVVDLPKMYYELLNFANTYQDLFDIDSYSDSDSDVDSFDEDDPFFTILKQAGKAMDEDDLTKFYNCRDNLLRAVRAQVQASYMNVFLSDPDPKSSWENCQRRLRKEAEEDNEEEAVDQDDSGIFTQSNSETPPGS